MSSCMQAHWTARFDAVIACIGVASASGRARAVQCGQRPGDRYENPARCGGRGRSRTAEKDRGGAHSTAALSADTAAAV